MEIIYGIFYANSISESLWYLNCIESLAELILTYLSV